MRSALKNALSIFHVNTKSYLNAGLNYCEWLFGVAKPLSFPVMFDIILTKACNLRCTFCVSYGSLKNQHWMPFELYERIASKLFPTAHSVFFCSGGEPFLYPQIRDALRLAREHRTLTTISSNGMLLNREIAQWLTTDKSLHELCISFDGSSKKTLERIRRGANYETILSNIEYLSFLKKKRRRVFPRLWFRYVIMKSNAEELPKIIPICAKYGLYKVVVKYLNVSNDIDFKESVFNHPKLAAQVFRETRRLAKEYGVRVDLPPLTGGNEHTKRCLNPWQFCQIDTDGSIKFCYQSWRQRIGFFSDRFESLWQGEHYQKIRRSVDSEAPYYPYCRYCYVRRGVNRESSHNQKLHAESYVIPGLEAFQVPFNLRAEENVSSFREFHAVKKT